MTTKVHTPLQRVMEDLSWLCSELVQKGLGINTIGFVGLMGTIRALGVNYVDNKR